MSSTEGSTGLSTGLSTQHLLGPSTQHGTCTTAVDSPLLRLLWHTQATTPALTQHLTLAELEALLTQHGASLSTQHLPQISTQQQEQQQRLLGWHPTVDDQVRIYAFRDDT